MKYPSSKIDRKVQTQKMINQILRDPRFIESQKKKEEEAEKQAFDAFLLISADYMVRNFGCKKAGLLKYIDFVVKQMRYVEHDEDYFMLLNEELERETGVNILECRLEEKDSDRQ